MKPQPKRNAVGRMSSKEEEKEGEGQRERGHRSIINVAVEDS